MSVSIRKKISSGTHGNQALAYQDISESQITMNISHAVNNDQGVQYLLRPSKDMRNGHGIVCWIVFRMLN